MTSSASGLVRGLDIYRVTLPGQQPPAATTASPGDDLLGSAALPAGVVGAALTLSAGLSRRRRATAAA